MTTSEKRKPRQTGNHDAAQNQIQQRHSTTQFREFISMILAALIFAASVWSSVFGMTGQFGPTSEVIGMMAGGGSDE